MADTAAGPGGSGTRSGSKQSTNPADNYHLARRRTLQVVVSSLLTEAGFESAEKASVETLTEMLQSYISEIGRSAKSYCEHTARTQPTLSDIVVTLVEMGFNVDTLPAYAKRSQRMVITAPPVTNQPVTPKALTAGQNRPHPPHIPSHFPEFPDPHTYIKTPTYREPVSDYQVLREKAASQRRDVERALTRFMAKTGETQSLFKDDVSTFPLIAARPFTVPYLTALLPSELEIQQMEETDSSEQDEQTDTENAALHVSTGDSGAEKENASVLQQNSSLSGSRNGEESVIDNPYLRPVKKPKIRRKKLTLKQVPDCLNISFRGPAASRGGPGLQVKICHGPFCPWKQTQECLLPYHAVVLRLVEIYWSDSKKQCLTMVSFEWSQLLLVCDCQKQGCAWATWGLNQHGK
ncbi:transcription initiation factor TFIID subunit 8 isoform X2 [Mesocricetus auratus]|uniref:Transcription initiation factor TFIID subunit 8 n=1 Tax=Mesocricetus auratus TaxID=10036 RepID=A0ABM2W3L2_MESAU|nr:transcription initiation factor TFIID subunit 8 isoform X2 [Mesocricetus auratus]